MLSIPLVLGISTEFEWSETTSSTETDVAFVQDGVVAMCGSPNREQLSLGTAVAFSGNGWLMDPAVGVVRRLEEH